MNTDQAISRFPRLAQVIGESWMRRNPGWFEAIDMPLPVWYEQLDHDLTVLSGKVTVHQLITCYRSMLRDHKAFLDGLYEVHSAALLASISDTVDLHVPRVPGEATNFDVRVEIGGYLVSADCKTRRDVFPFNLPRIEDEDGLRGFSGSRAALDPHDAQSMGLSREREDAERKHIATPEATVIRQRLLEALAQLPEAGLNLVLFGHIHGDRGDLERALFGAPVVDFVRNHVAKDVTAEWRLAGTAAFAGESCEAFAGLSGILWFRILHVDGSLRRAYKLYVNPHPRSPLPARAAAALEAARARWATEPLD